MKRNRILWGLMLATVLFMLAGCAGEKDGNDESTTSSAVGVETTEADLTEAISATEGAIESDWVTGVIGEGIEITNVVEFAGGLIGSNSMALYYSSDGITWSLTKDLSPYPFYTIFPAGGQMVVYDSGNAHVTTDGMSWNSASRDDYHMFHAVMHDGKQYVKVDTSKLYTSEDGGKFWPVQSDPQNPLTQVFFLDDDNKPTSISKLKLYGGTYYAVGAGIWTSTDLYNWTKVIKMSDLTYGGEDLLYNGSMLLMPAFYEIYAFDGSAVTRGNAVGSTYLVYGDKFYAVSNSGRCLISTDGIVWETLFDEDSNVFSVYSAVIFGGKLYAYGEDGQYRYVVLE